MAKTFRFLIAALMLSALVGLSSGARAQSTGGVSLLDPTTVPVVGGVVEALVADSGLTGALFLNVLNPSFIPDIGGILGLGGSGGPSGIIAALPGAGALEPIVFPLLGTVNSLGLPLLDPSALGGLAALGGGASASGDMAGGLPLVSSLPIVGGLIPAGGTGGDAAALPIPVVGPLLSGLLGGLLGGGQ